MRAPPLPLAFSIAFAATLFIPLPLCFFAPFLALATSSFSRIRLLWVGAGVGAAIDLLSVYPLGFHMAAYVAALALTRPFRIHFAAKGSSFLITTLFIALLSALFSRLLLLAMDTAFPLTWKGAASDLLLMPLMSTLFAALYFLLPFQFPFWHKEGRRKKEEIRHAQ